MKEQIETTLAAMDALIRALLETKNPQRYIQIAKICGNASHVAKMLPQALRVAAAVREADDGHGHGVVLPGGGTVAIVDRDPMGMYEAQGLGEFPYEDVQGDAIRAGDLLRRVPAEPSFTDLVRELLSAAPGLLGIAQQRPPAKRLPATQLSALLDVRDRLIKARMDTRPIDKQIKAAVAAMDKESTDAVVPPIVLRGHQAGDARREDDRAGGEINTPGEGGAGEAPSARAQEGMDPDF